ncbi:MULTISPECIES: hypothetical protein [Rhizobium]|uniref:Lipoprotein n=1 Tax=Rhizobium rhododendri TaxID=2506430 RepID=A0ABY8IR09_9HYPH|nr:MULTISPECIES: hypothetical protein [Rhizobium]TQX85186.1 hypothetical protein EQW76_22435 [Rhizobium sp. rho-13.1]TQY09474.1 hypothetical protein EQW74_21640 [Rhizobium sp. rho-1.1]WFS25956.1 hypothetical protein PR018_20795 [Rhizobium rhododendri]
MLQAKMIRQLAFSAPLITLALLTLTGCVSEQNQGVAAQHQLYEVFSPGSDVPHFVTADKVSEYTQGKPQSGMEQDASQDDQEQYQRAVQQDLSNREFLRGQQGFQ